MTSTAFFKFLSPSPETCRKGVGWREISQAMPPPPPPSSVILFLLFLMNHLQHYKQTQRAISSSHFVTKKKYPINIILNESHALSYSTIIKLPKRNLTLFWQSIRWKNFRSSFLVNELVKSSRVETRKNVSKLSHKLERAQHFFVASIYYVK